MHELALTQPIVEIAVENAEKAGAIRISKIVVVVGKLSGAVPHSIEFCFLALSQGTLAENAELIIVEEPSQGTCKACGATFEVEDRYYPCPACNAFDISTEGGDRFYLKEIEIENDAAASTA